MSIDNKLAMLKSFLKVESDDSDYDLLLLLDFAKTEILNWLYSGKTPEGISDVPENYTNTQVMACVIGYGVSGAEGQESHSEGGISRTFKYPDMISYIRSNVFPYVGVI